TNRGCTTLSSMGGAVSRCGRDFTIHATFVAIFVVSHLCIAPLVWADYWSGLDAYKRKDYALAVREWKVLADEGHAQAQVSLGWLYLNGRGVAQDYVLARKLFEKAAVQGQPQAQYNLAQLYHNGQGGAQDQAQACHWYEKAALQGSADAQVNLGTLYLNGRGCRQDDKEAAFW